MTPQITPSSGRKDLQDLYKLPRAPISSYLRKQKQLRAPRQKITELQPTGAPTLGAYKWWQVWKWIPEYLLNRFGPKHPFQDYSAFDSDNGVYALQGDTGEIRIALAGDWATGTDEAALVAERITAFQPHYSIHLGDVYYVGDRVEVDENFLGIRNPDNQFEPCLWPNGSQGAFALNGNHEMYARGYAYFDRMLPTLGPIVNGKAQGQRASFFCLENDYWRIIALDTGYNSIGKPVLEKFIWKPDCTLPPKLLAWIRAAVRPRDDGRGIVILSHHEYFSRFDDWYPKPAKQLAEFFSRPVLWFWGHEHRMAIYKDDFGVDGGIRAYGRCVGHGGMPVDLPPAEPKHPECLVEFVDSRPYQNHEHLTIGFNGFVRMTLQANHLEVEYVDLNNHVVFSERWSVSSGTLTRVRARRWPEPVKPN